MRLGVVLAPAAVALCLSDATLGSLAASKKLSGRGVDFSRLADSLADGSRPVDFLAIRVADEDPTAARRRAIVPGRPVTVLGVVLREPSAGGPVRLGRFYITCCVADSVVMDVAVYPRPGQRPARKDAWLRATGVLDRRRGHLVIAEARIAPVPRPAHPYLPFNL